uniref:RRM domain-containing protein n=1 Tax=Stomoxys calcitrans TaxID=35570 RepID=A0A1I8P561_STOCA|nr:unnamed protein product [Stomoxys calcitrans]
MSIDCCFVLAMDQYPHFARFPASSGNFRCNGNQSRLGVARSHKPEYFNGYAMRQRNLPYFRYRTASGAGLPSSYNRSFQERERSRNYDSANSTASPLKYPPPKGPRTPPYPPPPTDDESEIEAASKRPPKNDNSPAYSELGKFRRTKEKERRYSSSYHYKRKWSNNLHSSPVEGASQLNTAVQSYLLQALTTQHESSIDTTATASTSLCSYAPPLPPPALIPPPPPLPLLNSEIEMTEAATSKCKDANEGAFNESQMNESPVQPAVESSSKEAIANEEIVKAAEPSVKMKSKRGKISRMAKTNDWTMEEAEMALRAEQELSKDFGQKKILYLGFPDPPLSREIVQAYSKDIEYVHFQQNCAPRFCFVHLKEDAAINEVIENISKIPFGTGFVKAELKQSSCTKTVTSMNTSHIDPFTLYVGNLQANVACKVLKTYFYGAVRIDIGFAQRMKHTRYAFIRYRKVEDAIAAYRRMINTEIDGRSIVLRFRRVADALQSNENSEDHSLRNLHVEEDNGVTEMSHTLNAEGASLENNDNDNLETSEAPNAHETSLNKEQSSLGNDEYGNETERNVNSTNGEPESEMVDDLFVSSKHATNQMASVVENNALVTETTSSNSIVASCINHQDLTDLVTEINHSCDTLTTNSRKDVLTNNKDASSHNENDKACGITSNTKAEFYQHVNENGSIIALRGIKVEQPKEEIDYEFFSTSRRNLKKAATRHFISDTDNETSSLTSGRTIQSPSENINLAVNIKEEEDYNEEAASRAQSTLRNGEIKPEPHDGNEEILSIHTENSHESDHGEVTDLNLENAEPLVQIIELSGPYKPRDGTLQIKDEANVDAETRVPNKQTRENNRQRENSTVRNAKGHSMEFETTNNSKENSSVSYIRNSKEENTFSTTERRKRKSSPTALNRYKDIEIAGKSKQRPNKEAYVFATASQPLEDTSEANVESLDHSDVRITESHKGKLSTLDNCIDQYKKAFNSNSDDPDIDDDDMVPMDAFCVHRNSQSVGILVTHPLQIKEESLEWGNDYDSCGDGRKKSTFDSLATTPRRRNECELKQGEKDNKTNSPQNTGNNVAIEETMPLEVNENDSSDCILLSWNDSRNKQPMLTQMEAHSNKSTNKDMNRKQLNKNLVDNLASHPLEVKEELQDEVESLRSKSETEHATTTKISQDIVPPISANGTSLPITPYPMDNCHQVKAKNLSPNSQHEEALAQSNKNSTQKCEDSQDDDDDDIVPENNALCSRQRSIAFFDLTLEDEISLVTVKNDLETQDMFLMPQKTPKQRKESQEAKQSSSSNKCNSSNEKTPESMLSKASSTNSNTEHSKPKDFGKKNDVILIDDEDVTMQPHKKSPTNIKNTIHSPFLVNYKKSSGERQKLLFTDSYKVSRYGDNLDKLFELLNSDSEEEDM